VSRVPDEDMSRAQFSISYDGPALADHKMNVRDLAPALLAVGELFDAANQVLNGDASQVAVHVRAHEPGCFTIDLEVVQHLIQRGIALLTGDGFTAALNLKELIVGGGVAAFGLIALIKRLKGKAPDRIAKIAPGLVRITIGDDTFDVPLKLLRLYQDLTVRHAAERVVKQPLEKDGIDVVRFISNGAVVESVEKEDAENFTEPDVEEKTLLEDQRRAAYSIVSLAFKEDNKWRLHDGSNQINVFIRDEDFLRRVDQNLESFSKGDVLICEVSVSQKQTKTGLRTEYAVDRVIEHIRAPRQLEFKIEDDGDEPS